MNILLTGAAGFIGFHSSLSLLDKGHSIFGADNLNAYYDPALKEARLGLLKKRESFSFEKIELADKEAVARLFEENEFDLVIHLAAQAGVRYSLENPHAYVDANLTAFLNILEGCRHQQIDNLIYASSSSVYGGNKKLPFAESDRVDHPISLYAATKKANELMAHTYHHLFSTKMTGLRFFTVYGPWGRPDMAMFKFAKAILAGETIDVYGNGEMWRDFTYVDDIVEGIVRIAEGKREPGASESTGYDLYNIGNNNPEYLMDLIGILETELGKKALINFLPMQPGDVRKTYADTTSLEADYGFKPKTPLAEGVKRFVDWYKEYTSLKI